MNAHGYPFLSLTSEGTNTLELGFTCSNKNPGMCYLVWMGSTGSLLQVYSLCEASSRVGQFNVTVSLGILLLMETQGAVLFGQILLAQSLTGDREVKEIFGLLLYCHILSQHCLGPFQLGTDISPTTYLEHAVFGALCWQCLTRSSHSPPANFCSQQVSSFLVYFVIPRSKINLN